MGTENKSKSSGSKSPVPAPDATTAAMQTAARVAAPLQRLAREAAEKLPFDAEPSGFQKLHEALARNPESDD